MPFGVRAKNIVPRNASNPLDAIHTLFDEGTVNWGRIVVCFIVARELSRTRRFEKMAMVHAVGVLLDDVFGDWVREEGGWEHMLKFRVDENVLAIW